MIYLVWFGKSAEKTMRFIDWITKVALEGAGSAVKVSDYELIPKVATQETPLTAATPAALTADNAWHLLPGSPGALVHVWATAGTVDLLILPAATDPTGITGDPEFSLVEFGPYPISSVAGVFYRSNGGTIKGTVR